MMTPTIARIQQFLSTPTPTFLAVLLVSGIACDAGSFVEPQDGSREIQASAGSHTFTALEQKEKFTAQAFNDAGESVKGATFHWSSANGAVATVDQAGTVTAKAPGATTIEVASDCCAGADTIRILIEQVPVTLSLSPHEADVGVGQSIRMDVDVRDANGYPIAGVIDFASDNEGVIEVGADGEADALAPGTATISAKSGNASGNARMNVEKSETGTGTAVAEVRASTDAHYFPALGLTVALDAEALDADGNTVKNESLTWSSLDTKIATVKSNGRVTAEGVGSTKIVIAADCCAAADTVNINIEQVPTEITVNPSEVSLQVGETVRLEAEATDANGFVIPGAVSFSSSAKGVATVASTGTVEAVAAGSASITAAAGDVSAKASVVVEGSGSESGSESESESEPLVAEVRATPTSHTFKALEETLQLSAEALDGTGHTVPDVTFEWTSSNTSIATVNSMGLVTAKSVGTAAIVVAATCCSAADTVAITVQEESTTTPGAFYSDDFEAYADGGDLQGAGDGSFKWGQQGQSVGVRVSSDIARAGTKSLKFPVQQGDQYNNEARFNMGRQVTSIWLEYYLYYPDGAEGISGVGAYGHGEDLASSDNDKFLRIWGDAYSDKSKFGFETRPLADNEDERLYHTYKIPQGPYSSPSVDPWVNDTWRGQWIQVRIEALLDDGSDNGEVRMWRDGVLVLERTGLDQEAELGVGYWDQGYIFGAANSGAPRDSAIYLDDIKFFDTDPGW